MLNRGARCAQLRLQTNSVTPARLLAQRFPDRGEARRRQLATRFLARLICDRAEVGQNRIPEQASRWQLSDKGEGWMQ